MMGKLDLLKWPGMTIAVTVAFAGMAFGDVALDADFSTALKASTGSVDVIIGGDTDPASLSALLDGLAASSVEQVRFSAVYGAPAARRILQELDKTVAGRGKNWHVCQNWFLSTDKDFLGPMIREEFGGSVVFFDNGRTTDVIENPEADMAAGMSDDALFGGVLQGKAQRVSDVSKYFDAVSAIWSEIVPVQQIDEARQSRGGWIDGC